MKLKNKISQTLPYQVDTPVSPFKAAEFDFALGFLAQLGFTGIELAIPYPGKVDADDLLKKLDAHGLAATTISTGQIYGLEGIFMASFDDEIRKRASEVMKSHIELSAKIGFPPVTVGLIRGKLEQGEKSLLTSNFREAILPCFEYAAKLGVILQIEPVNSEETVLINTVAEALEFIASLGSPQNAGVLFDVFHSYKQGENMPDAIRAAAGRLTNVHFADSDRGLPGFGDVDFMPVSRALCEIGYQGPYTLETLVIPDREFVNAHCYQSIMDAINDKAGSVC